MGVEDTVGLGLGVNVALGGSVWMGWVVRLGWVVTGVARGIGLQAEQRMTKVAKIGRKTTVVLIIPLLGECHAVLLEMQGECIDFEKVSFDPYLIIDRYQFLSIEMNLSSHTQTSSAGSLSLISYKVQALEVQ
jgi:hypothetical protein